MFTASKGPKIDIYVFLDIYVILVYLKAIYILL